MKKILAIGASSSKNSINRTWANYVAHQIESAEVTLLDLNDFEMPIYSIDREKENGIPEKAQQFRSLIASHDAIVISLAEHNGSYTTAFKNILDWASRMEGGVWSDKAMFLLSTSPGKRGGATVFGLASKYFQFMSAKIIAGFSLPSFRQFFKPEEGITDLALAAQFAEQLSLFQTHLERQPSFS